MKIFGFSLMELVVAIFILASLIGMAVPSYLSHVNKSQIASALVTLGGLERAAKQAYEENPSNGSIVYANTTFTSNTLTALNASPVVNALYIAPGGNANVSNKQFVICVYVDKLSVTGYVAPTPGTTGTHTRLCKQVTANDAIYTAQCGSLQSAAVDVPTNILPSTCNCPLIWGGTC